MSINILCCFHLVTDNSNHNNFNNFDNYNFSSFLQGTTVGSTKNLKAAFVNGGATDTDAEKLCHPALSKKNSIKYTKYT